ncbi:MAG: HD domain-containing protein [Acidobacteria bacterium]|nr:HD domain-containing protein [Acidobacteriota bacterium]
MPFSARFEEALVYAAQLHKNQLRKGSHTPYVAHLLAVAALVIEYGGDENQAIAALLHDAIEDQGGDAIRQEIRRRFGDDVTELVDGCTDAETIPKPPWRARKEAYIEHLQTASARVRLVSAADKLHNARAILTDYRVNGEGVWGYFRGGKEGTLWYYRTLLTVFQAGEPNRLIDELEHTVRELEALVGQNEKTI